MPKKTKNQSPSDAGHVGNDQKEQLWRKRIAAWRASGVSKRAYCTQHDVPYWSFVDWARKIELKEGEEVPPARVAAPLSEGSAQGGNPFVQIRLVSPAPVEAEKQSTDRSNSDDTQQIEIVLPSGAVVRLNDGCNPVFVGNLLSALKG